MRVPCGVWSLPVLVPLYVPVLICHVKVQQHEVDLSMLIGRLIIPMANQEWRSSALNTFCQCNLLER